MQKTKLQNILEDPIYNSNSKDTLPGQINTLSI